MTDMPPPPHEPQDPQPYGQFPPPPPGYPMQPGMPYPYYVPRRTNGLAIASMVLGILWIYWIGSILALIFGYIARQQIKERNEDGNGMAIAGIVLGWIGIAVLVIVILLFFVLGSITTETFSETGTGA